MEKDVLKSGMKFLQAKKKRKRRHKVVFFLACFVVLCTSYALILPAITMEKSTFCGQEEQISEPDGYADAESEPEEEDFRQTEENTEELNAETIEEETPEPEEETVEEETPEEEKPEEEMPEPEEETPEEETVEEEKPEEETIEEETLQEEEPEEETAEEPAEGDRVLTMTAEGTDYIVTVSLTEASVPENAELQVSEIEPGSEEYESYCRQTTEALQTDSDEVSLSFARFFDIAFMADGQRMEPEAPVEVKIDYTEGVEIPEEEQGKAVHFTNDGAEVLDTCMESDENGAVAFVFTQESFSVTGTVIKGEQSKEAVLHTAGEDYTVTVSYDENAGISESAVLKIEEIDTESEDYQAELADANEALNACGQYVRKARFFDISIMDGETEIEPQSAVHVKMELAAETNVTPGDVIITHENEIISPADTEEADGNVTVSFETDSFSHYGTIYAGESETITVDDTADLSGTESYSTNSWSVSESGILELSESEHTATVTGRAAGTVTVTHTYKVAKYNGGGKFQGTTDKSEYFVITVNPSENAVLTESASEYTVTVKGNKKILTDDVKLHVEDFGAEETDYQDYYDALVSDLQTAASASISEESFDFLHMYHIYLTKTGVSGEYIPEENVNLQVTITYDNTPDDWEKVNWVGHYKKTGSTVSGLDVSDGSSSAKGVKKIKVSGNSITFHIQSFSVFPIAALGTDSGGSSSGSGGTAAPDGSILTSEQLSWIGDASSNEWQIVDQEYAGNAGTDKTESEDGNVRVQKNVIPTGVENEFLVYLSIDTKQLFSDYFASAQYEATESNSEHASALGTVIDSVGGSQKVLVSGEPIYDNYAAFTILSSDGELLADNITLYWSKANNVTFYLKVNDGDTVRYVLTGVKVSKNSSNVIMLSDEAERLIMSNIAQMANLVQVTDVMGDYVDFISVVSGDYDTEPAYDESARTLTWEPAVKDNPSIDKVKSDESKEVEYTDRNGKLQTITTYRYTSWTLNTAELIYKVRLNTAKSGFAGAAYNMNSSVGDPESFEVNASASLTYESSKSVDFQKPYVRGLLYDIQFDKVEAGKPSEKLSGAVFELKDSAGVSYTVTEESAGTYRALDLPWGTYTLTEKTPPKGYKKGKENPGSWTIDVSYTKDSSNLVQDSAKTANMRFTGMDNADGVWQIENERAIYVDLIKTDMSYGVLLNGAKFSLYDSDPSLAGSAPMEGCENMEATSEGIIADNLELEDGKTYYLVENKAPDGYILPDKDVVLTVNTENAADPISVDGGAGRAEKTAETQQVDQEDVTVYVIKIPNNPGVELPSTGGTGTLPYTSGGLGLILTSLLMYGCSAGRRRERRLK